MPDSPTPFAVARPAGELGIARGRRSAALLTAAAAALACVLVLASGSAEVQASEALARADAQEADAAAARTPCLDAALAPPPPRANASATGYKLTRALVASAARGRTVTVTWCNLHYVTFALNWVAHARAAGMANLLVGALDDGALAALVEAGVPAFSMAAGLPASDFGWGSPTFHAMGRHKVGLARAFVGLGFDVLLCDVDTVWLRDPWPLLDAYPAAAILTSSDALASTARPGGGLEAWPAAGAAAANIGVTLFRPASAPLLAEWDAVLAADASVWDQNGFNDLFRRGAAASAEPSGLFRAYDGHLLMGILPVTTFASGHTHFVQRLAEAAGDVPYVVHATFQFSGTAGKRHRLRDGLLWAVDGPEHYDPPGGLLTVDLDVGSLLPASAPRPPDGSLASFTGHFALVNAQLGVLRAAFGLATALNRTLVLPRLWCGADRYWAPHAGRLPGAAGTRLPFRCPADHVLDLDALTKPLPVAEYGPPLRFREASLLANPRVPARVRDGVVRVVACDPGQDCPDGPGRAPQRARGVVRLRSSLNDAELRAALAEYTQTPVIAFANASSSFGGFADPADGARFLQRVHGVASSWCCVDAHPGHVWYDVWNDVVPHVDRHGRTFSGPWFPLTGP